MSTIVPAARVEDFFEEAVTDAMKTRSLDASDGARTYLVSLLAEAAKPGSTVERALEGSLTLMLGEALETPQVGDRFERLRCVGDGVLYGTAFFADHFQARGVDQGYLIGIGRSAYEGAGSLLRRGGDEPLDLFGELSEKFASFVAVLAHVADTTIARSVASSRGIVKLYERWLRTGSDSLADALSAHGFVAPRGAKVVQ